MLRLLEQHLKAQGYATNYSERNDCLMIFHRHPTVTLLCWDLSVVTLLYKTVGGTHSIGCILCPSDPTFLQQIDDNIKPPN